MVRQPIQPIEIFCDNPIHEDTKAEKKAQCVHRYKSRARTYGKLGRCSGPPWVPGGETSHVSQGEDTPVSRSDFRLHLVSLKRCTKVKYEYGVIQSFEAGGEKTPCGDDLAVASRQSILKQRPYSSRRNALRQDRPGSGPGKENMNPEDENKLGHKKAISCEQSSMRFSTGSSMMMRCESKSPPAMTLEPQVEPLYLVADQHRTLATAKIERRRRSPIASLIHLPYLHSLQSTKAAVQMQVRYGPEQSKDGIIPRHRAKAGQKKKWPCGKLASQSVSSLAAPLTPTPIPLPIVLYSSFEADKLRPRKLVYSWLDKLEPGIVSCQQRMIMTILEEYVRSLGLKDFLKHGALSVKAKGFRLVLLTDACSLYLWALQATSRI